MILVGTFLDKMDITPEDKRQEIERLEGLIQLKIPYAREALQLCPVSCISTEGKIPVSDTLDLFLSFKLSW